jgi:Putative peptidoglycan binding domain
MGFPFGLLEVHTTMRLLCVTVFAFLVLAGWAGAVPLEIGAVNGAQLQLPLRENERINPILIKAQILLDRARFSPGEIDGKFGDNLKKALLAFAATQGLNSKGELTDEIWQKLTSTNSDPVLTKYTLSKEDVWGPFVDSIPTKLEKKKDLPVLAYTSPREKSVMSA